MNFSLTRALRQGGFRWGRGRGKEETPFLPTEFSSSPSSSSSSPPNSSDLTGTFYSSVCWTALLRAIQTHRLPSRSSGPASSTGAGPLLCTTESSHPRPWSTPGQPQLTRRSRPPPAPPVLYRRDCCPGCPTPTSPTPTHRLLATASSSSPSSSFSAPRMSPSSRLPTFLAKPSAKLSLEQDRIFLHPSFGPHEDPFVRGTVHLTLFRQRTLQRICVTFHAVAHVFPLRQGFYRILHGSRPNTQLPQSPSLPH